MEINAYLWDLLRQCELLLNRYRALLERTLLICGLNLLAEIDCSLENSYVFIELYLQFDVGAFFNVFAKCPGCINGAVFATRRGWSADPVFRGL